MTTTDTIEPSSAGRELIHAVNNFLNLVVTTGQVALDERLDYSPEKALDAILEEAEGLAELVRISKPALIAGSKAGPARKHLSPLLD